MAIENEISDGFLPTWNLPFYKNQTFSIQEKYMVVDKKYWWWLKNDNWISREYRQRLVDWDVYEFGAHLGHTWGKIDHQAVYRLAQALLDSGMAVIITNIFLDLPFFKPCPTPFYHEPSAILKAVTELNWRTPFDKFI